MSNQGTSTRTGESRSGMTVAKMQYQHGTTAGAELFTKLTERLADLAGTTISKDMRTLILDGSLAPLAAPNAPEDKASRAKFEEYRVDLKQYKDELRQREKDQAKTFRLLMSHCDEVMKEKIESSDNYDELEEKDDVGGLIALIKDLTIGGEKVQYEPWTQQAQLRDLLTMEIGYKETVPAFAKRFLAQLAITEERWGKLIPQKQKGRLTADQEAAREKFLACMFLAAVQKRFKDVVDELHNEFLLGNLSYPEDIPSMVALLINRRGANSSGKRDRVGLTFAQSETKTAKLVCWYCNEKGHVRVNCPKRLAKKQGSTEEETTETEGQVHFQWTD
jgi:C2H2 zinc-finger